MREIISKELLGEILFNSRIDIKEVVRTRDNSLNYSIFASINERDGTNFNSNIEGNYYVEKRIMYDDINIYELAHKCKEWAFENGYVVKSCKSCAEDSIMWVASKFRDISYLGIEKANTEPESIFKACQWILDNKPT